MKTRWKYFCFIPALKLLLVLFLEWFGVAKVISYFSLNDFQQKLFNTLIFLFLQYLLDVFLSKMKFISDCSIQVGTVQCTYVTTFFSVGLKSIQEFTNYTARFWHCSPSKFSFLKQCSSFMQVCVNVGFCLFCLFCLFVKYETIF